LTNSRRLCARWVFPALAPSPVPYEDFCPIIVELSRDSKVDKLVFWFCVISLMKMSFLSGETSEVEKSGEKWAKGAKAWS
jgi:hypothetical protein